MENNNENLKISNSENSSFFEQKVSSSNGNEDFIPKLRFKEFCKNWSCNNMGSLGTFTKGAPLSKADISETGFPFILYGELYTTYKEVTYHVYRQTDANAPKECFSNIGDVIIPTSGETPEEIATATCVMVPNVILGGDLNIYRNNAVDGRIISYIINHKINKSIAKVAQGKSVVHIKADDLSKMNIKYPEKDEQAKIINFLWLIDQRIEKQRQLVESLKKYKRGLFIQLYNQSSKNKIQIKNLGEYFSAGILSKDDLIENGSNPCILYGELFTKYNEVIQDICSFTNKSLPTKTQGTEILFPSSTTVDALSLICPSSINQSNVILGGDLFAIRLKKDFDNDFMSYLFNYIYKRLLAKFAQGITIVHLHYSDIKEQFIEVPNVDEQIKIIKIVNNIEKYILKNEKIHENLKSTKQGLLQQMFI